MKKLVILLLILLNCIIAGCSKYLDFNSEDFKQKSKIDSSSYNNHKFPIYNYGYLYLKGKIVIEPTFNISGEEMGQKLFTQYILPAI